MVVVSESGETLHCPMTLDDFEQDRANPHTTRLEAGCMSRSVLEKANARLSSFANMMLGNPAL